ncbi:MAG TPA: hypothetical protein VFI45_20830, partial [Candidatus Acidoferrum sp.]|nr:hypothetical protein [Candidatus Acidoferrum sp.]
AFPRCEHRSPSGRQCSQPVCSTDPRFCGTHKPTPEQLATTELTEAAGTLSSSGEVHRFLKAVLLNRVRGRITPKEAAVYSYLCQNLLRSLREIDHFQELQSEREQRNILPELMWRLPRPDRPDRSDPPACPEHREGSPTPAEPMIVVNSAALDCANVGAGLARPPLTAESSTPAQSPIEGPATGGAASPSESSTSSTSFTSSTSTRPAATAPTKPSTSQTPPPPFDPRHFCPLDPTLPRGAQDHSRNIPPPDEAECRRLAARRGLPFKRTAHPGALR